MALRKKIVAVKAFVGLTVLALVIAFISLPKQAINLPTAMLWMRTQHPEVFEGLKDTIIENDKDVRAIGKTRQLPFFRLAFSRKDVVHFSDLYAKFEDPKYGVAYYAEHNKWRNASLEHDGKTYNVKVKSHGRNPTRHRNGKYISLSVKLPDGEQIANCRRFSLLVRDHFKPDKQIVFDLAAEFGVLRNQEELVRVAINNWDEKLYFFDRRFNDTFMETSGKPSMRLFGYSDSPYTTAKSSIHTSGSFDPEAFRKRFLLTLQELEYPDSHHLAIAERFVELNTAIAEQRVDRVKDFFDLDYLSSFEAVRLLAALNGHSLGRPDNLYIFYDTANGLFYPAITRDASMSAMMYVPGASPELFVNTTGAWELPLFRMISRHDQVRQATYKKIFEFIRANRDTVCRRHQLIREQYEKLSYFGWTMVGMRRLGILKDDYTANNLTVLQQYLSESSPEVRFTIDRSRLSIELLPRSLAAIKIDHLAVDSTCDVSGNVPINMAVTIESEQGVLRSNMHRLTASCDQGTIDLTSVLAHLDFSTALNADLQRSGRKYTVVLELDGADVLLSQQDLSFSLSNSVTGQRITTVKNNVRGGRVTPLDASVALVKDAISTTWESAYPELKVTETSDRIVIHSGDYTLNRDIVLPSEAKLVIEAGTTLRLGHTTCIVCYKGIDILGTEAHPVVITSISPEQPFGSVGVLGDEHTLSTIRHLQLSNGYERWVGGVYFSGALSLHYCGNVELFDCTIERNLADDGLNVKYGNVRIQRCVFRDNVADQVDLDICEGAILDSRFEIDQLNDANGDGLDVSGSTIAVNNCQFRGMADKGMSVGEASNVVCRESDFAFNAVGVAVKDLSRVCLRGNAFLNNAIDVDAYQKKSFFGGGTVYFDEFDPQIKLFLDAKSAAKVAKSDASFEQVANVIEKQRKSDAPAAAEDWGNLDATVLTEPVWRPTPFTEPELSAP